jgi:hypothetical protein
MLAIKRGLTRQNVYFPKIIGILTTFKGTATIHALLSFQPSLRLCVSA